MNTVRIDSRGTVAEVSEIIAGNLRKAGWSWGCMSAVDSGAPTIFVADAHCDGKRCVGRADEKLTAFVALELQLVAAKD